MLFSFVFSVKEKMKVLDALLLEVCVFQDFSHGAPLLVMCLTVDVYPAFFSGLGETEPKCNMATIIVFTSYVLCHIPYQVRLERHVCSGHAVLVLELGLHIAGVLSATT